MTRSLQNVDTVSFTLKIRWKEGPLIGVSAVDVCGEHPQQPGPGEDYNVGHEALAMFTDFFF